ncbi:ArsR family transcriptional regulator [Thermincola ferriacetica]|uniref:ArsR family transcriptional regulator n=1 Tax=Thermincola ferriacetica TaxID=281456 RepID=A0A0L6W0V7_9FIRM|nr:metalloregulator ArsR/SmtB family transcription factor [Thermincola ferriacetica]KNZ69165.1 ArsR family transcriptional regulator [Thermincola ferriacetica]
MDERLCSMEAEFFKALAHPTRVRILKHLKEGEKCVCEFTEDLDIEQSNMSQHLAILRKQNIVGCRKEGLKVIYKVNYPQIYEILNLVEDILVSQVNETLSLLNKRNKGKGGE